MIVPELNRLISCESKNAEKASGQLVVAPDEKKVPNALDSKINNAPIATMDDAQKQISSEVLEVLAEKFNGKLSAVRRVDSKDRLF